MKKLIIFALVFCCAFSISAQSKFGVRLGVSSTDFNPKDLVVLNQADMEQLKIAVDDAKFGYHLGVFAQLRKNRFFIQPEVVFNSNKVDYKVDNLEGNVGQTVLSETYNYVDVPINAGLKFGPLRVQAGPVGHFFLNSASELKDLDGYKEKFDQATFGMQYGFGLDIWRAVLDVKWERNFDNHGDHLNFNDVAYNFSDSPDRFIVSLGIKF